MTDLDPIAAFTKAQTNGHAEPDDEYDSSEYYQSVTDHYLSQIDRSATAPDAPTFRSRMLSLDDLSKLPPPQPLINGMLDLDSLALVYGRRGCGKSFLAVDWTASIATGARWHGLITETGPVIYVVAEGASGLAQRYDAWLGNHGGVFPPTPDQLLVLPESVNLLSPSSVAKFADEAAEYGARLIVFDTLSRCMVGGDENSAKDAGLAVEQLDIIRRHTGACVLPVHHAGKFSGAGARGSSAFEAAADAVFEMSASDGITTVTCTKQKNHVESPPVKFRLSRSVESMVLDIYHGGLTEAGSAALIDTLAALAVVQLPGGVSNTIWRDQMIDKTSKSPATFSRHLKELVSIGFVTNVASEKQPRYVVSETGEIALTQGDPGDF